MSVDESPETRAFIKDCVERLGYDFIEAANGFEALNLLQTIKRQVDIILLEWHLPKMDGMELLRQLKRNNQLKDIPVTMVTTEVKRSKVIEAITCGAHNYLMKPFTQEDLIDKIMESLGREI
jgi:two-component system chemotaxis response regulator CheY